MLLRITITMSVILVSFGILSSIANVYADINEEKAKMQRQLKDLVGIYNMNQDSSSLTSKDGSIAFVLPSFTMAAYDNSFYVFYQKYEFIKENITSDLNLLTSTVPEKAKSFSHPKSAGLQYLAQHTSQLSPNTNIDILTDEQVHNGVIFNSDKQNVYNALVLGHQEYVTQQEYDNFKKFVENGGVLILLDSNMFYAEVAYDPTNNKITLIKGHYWAFDGQKAWQDVKERWADENTQWVGSNYYCASGCKITFGNNPFQYTHYEEQFITNPNAKILIDYQETEEPDLNRTMGAYELKYKQGKVISFGIYGEHVVNNENFLKFYDNLLVENNILSNSNKKPQQEQQPISQADTLSKIPFSSGATN